MIVFFVRNISGFFLYGFFNNVCGFETKKKSLGFSWNVSFTTVKYRRSQYKGVVMICKQHKNSIILDEYP